MIQEQKGQTPQSGKPCLVSVRFFAPNFSWLRGVSSGDGVCCPEIWGCAHTRDCHTLYDMKREDCPQCHVPPAECRLHVKHPNPMRLRLDVRRDIERAVGDGESRDVTSFITEAAQVRLGYLRCDRGRCLEHEPPVPVEFGDLTGRPLSEWIAEAVREVDRQHPRHEPVFVGARPVPLPQAMFRPPMPEAVPDHSHKQGRRAS